MGSDGLFCFISICKIGSSKNPFAMVTSLSELYSVGKTKKNQKLLMAAAQAAEKHGDESSLTYLR